MKKLLKAALCFYASAVVIGPVIACVVCTYNAIDTKDVWLGIATAIVSFLTGGLVFAYVLFVRWWFDCTKNAEGKNGHTGRTRTDPGCLYELCGGRAKAEQLFRIFQNTYGEDRNEQFRVKAKAEGFTAKQVNALLNLQ